VANATALLPSESGGDAAALQTTGRHARGRSSRTPRFACSSLLSHARSPGGTAMTSMDAWALRFIRWGMGLSVAGLITGYIPLGHYLMKDSLPSCPAAPVHGHTILLSFVGMSIFGLLYRAMPAWMGSEEPPLRLIRLHFRLAVTGIIGVCVNGTIGYELLAMFADSFYYAGPSTQGVRNLWFGIDGAFLTLYAAGCGILLFILMTRTAYGPESRPQ
ncbi:MAG TPA: hypothetical protein VF111_15330, partial [Thermoanaerobaculia bacterium]